MTEENADLLRRVLAQIRAQRKNLYPGLSAQEHADRYHEQLDKLREAGYTVEDFRLNPERDMYYQVYSTDRRSGEQHVADTRSVRPGALETQMDAILDYFEQDAEQAPVKFNAPRR